jgi:hypothetical protein
MTDIQIVDVPAQVTHHARGRRIRIADRLQAAFGAFVAPDKFSGTVPSPGNDNSDAWRGDAAGGFSLADPLALPPDWHGANGYGGDLLSLSFLPFDR